MARELDVVDGSLVEVVKNHQPVEIAQLNAERDAAQTEVEAATTQVAEANDRLTKAQAALEESKSLVSRAEELVGQPATPGVDAGTEEPGTEVETTETPAEAANEVPNF